MALLLSRFTLTRGRMGTPMHSSIPARELPIGKETVLGAMWVIQAMPRGGIHGSETVASCLIFKETIIQAQSAVECFWRARVEGGLNRSSIAQPDCT